MTRSTELESESKSVSITRYDLQNARRESLLSQNWATSEDMNMRLNVEEKNTKKWSFDLKVIKINIKKKLNAWILNDKADDLIIFIKYMIYQHDIEIETHNDMIQMLEDVNETNIMLKITQTRLQKENRDKNVIICYLEAASSRQDTSTSEDWFLKSIKLLDSSLFKDSTQNVNNWLSWM